MHYSTYRKEIKNQKSKIKNQKSLTIKMGIQHR